MMLDYAKRIAVVFLFSFVLFLIMNGLTIAISGIEASGAIPGPVMHDALTLMLNNRYGT